MNFTLKRRAESLTIKERIDQYLVAHELHQFRIYAHQVDKTTHYDGDILDKHGSPIYAVSNALDLNELLDHLFEESENLHG